LPARYAGGEDRAIWERANAYVATIRYQLKQKGHKKEWRETVRIMNTQKCVTTTVENSNEQIISVRQCTQPTKQAANIYQLIKYKTTPFYRKKSVVVPVEIFKNDTS